MTQEELIHKKLSEFKRKYLMNYIIKGLLTFLTAFSVLFLIITTLEYIFHFDSITRTLLFFSILISSSIGLFHWIAKPVYNFIIRDKVVSDEQASTFIGLHFNQIQDKLLNLLQLQKQDLSNALVLESVRQKMDEVILYEFKEAVNFEGNKRFFIKFFLTPIAIILLLAIIKPTIITESTGRIIEFDKNVSNAPFQFEIQNENLASFYNEDFTFHVKLVGKSIPEELYVHVNNSKILCKKIDNHTFSYTFEKLINDTDFQLEGTGFFSEKFEITILKKPSIRTTTTELHYPSYLNKREEKVENNTNLQVPEGTKIHWEFKTENTQRAEIVFENNTRKTLTTGDNLFELDSIFKTSNSFILNLYNEHIKEPISYKYVTKVIGDLYPEISINSQTDTVFYSNLLINGNISDDYGFTALKLFYKTTKEKNFKAIPLALRKDQINQNYYYNLPLDSVKVQFDTELEYYVQVWDNDQFNGFKSKKSNTLSFKFPSKSDLTDKIDEEKNNIEASMDKLQQKAKDQNKAFEKLKDDLKGKKELSWQDEQELKNFLKEQEEIKKEVQQLKEQLEQNQFKEEKYQEQNEKLLEKAQELQELMKEVMNPELEKMYEELRKLMEEKQSMEKIQEKMKEMDYSNEQLQKELERNLELFKELKFEQKLQQNINELKELQQKQEELSKEAENKNTDAKELEKKQEELNKQFDELKKEMKEMEQMNEELQQKNDLENFDSEMKDIKEEMQKSSESLQKNQKKNAGQNQKKAADKMQKMANKMEQMKDSMEMESMEEDLNNLRLILENLLVLSFEQEKLMKAFQNIQRTDPRFVELSQQQLKLKDDARLVEDSLVSLSKRVFQIKGIVLKELTDMKMNIDEASDAIKQRNPGKASGKQQYAMTAMNNLALLLSDVMKQMQEQMAKQKEGDQMCNKPKKGKGKPSMSQLQKQLNQQMQEMKDGKDGKNQGKQLSQKLAQLAAEQERIRRGLKEMEKEGGEKGAGGKNISDEIRKLEQLMKETEKDIVNKNITQQTINRQQEIMTRLLEAETAEKEREKDNKRESKTAQQFDRNQNNIFDEYIKQKEKEVELLKSISPDLTPYYKEKVNQYYKTINQ